MLAELCAAGPFAVAEDAITVVAGYAECTAVLRDPVPGNQHLSRSMRSPAAPELYTGALAYRPHVNLRGPERLDVGFARSDKVGVIESSLGLVRRVE